MSYLEYEYETLDEKMEKESRKKRKKIINICKKYDIPLYDSDIMILIEDNVVNIYSAVFTWGMNNVVNQVIESFLCEQGYNIQIKDDMPVLLKDGDIVECSWHFPKSGINGKSIIELLNTKYSNGTDLLKILQKKGYTRV